MSSQNTAAGDAPAGGAAALGSPPELAPQSSSAAAAGGEETDSQQPAQGQLEVNRTLAQQPAATRAVAEQAALAMEQLKAAAAAEPASLPPKLEALRQAAAAVGLVIDLVPYGGCVGGGVDGRLRAISPQQPRPQPSMQLVLQDYPHLLKQLNGRELAPVPPGEVHFTWLQPAWSSPAGGALLPELTRQAVEEAARAAAAAAEQEARHTGFGKHIMERGWNVVVLPVQHNVCQLNGPAGDVLVLSTGLVEACMRHSSHPAAAIMESIAHEMGHCVARHVCEPLTFVCSLEGASAVQHTKWQWELEADEFAAAVLLRARVLPGALGEYLRAGGSSRVQQMRAGPVRLKQTAVALDAAAGDKWQGPSDVQRLKQAANSRSADQVERTRLRLEAMEAAESARTTARTEPSPSATITVGTLKVLARPLAALPTDEAVAVVQSLAHSHPPYEARLARLCQLAGRPDMLLRSAAPALTPGSWGSSGLTPAEHVAELMATAQAAERQKQRRRMLKRTAEFAMYAAGLAVFFGLPLPGQRKHDKQAVATRRGES
ncbi:hypothetical protein ABPG75_000134 [Micractinium tetrahymenae]